MTIRYLEHIARTKKENEMKKSLLIFAQKNPDKQILINNDALLGELLTCSLNDLRKLSYIDTDEDLLEYDIQTKEI